METQLLDNENDLVVCRVQCYDMNEQMILVGRPGLKKDSVYNGINKKQIPRGLVDSMTITAINSIGTITIPKWLAAKKELEHESQEETNQRPPSA